MKRLKTCFIAFLLIVGGCSEPIVNFDSTGEAIICFGNSLTAGQGANRYEAYPAVLSELLGKDVINAGRSGETTKDALKRLEEDVLNQNPRLAIVEFGANDAFEHIPLKTTISNLDKIITDIQEKGSMVVLVSVKMALFADDYTREYRELAEQKGALFIPNMLKGVLADSRLKSDTIHPNANGYRKIAERIYKEIKHLLK